MDVVVVMLGLQEEIHSSMSPWEVHTSNGNSPYFVLWGSGACDVVRPGAPRAGAPAMPEAEHSADYPEPRCPIDENEPDLHRGL